VVDSAMIKVLYKPVSILISVLGEDGRPPEQQAS
jgi:hypothetical protein